MSGSRHQRIHIGIAAAFLLVDSTPVAAQSAAMRQDSTLNNLEHERGYVTAPLGSLGAVVRRGSGPIDVLIIPGLGFGAEDFEVFMREHASRYRMVAVTLPGFGGTAAPPMPPAGTSYAEATWTRAAAEAIARVIEREQLRKPIVVGHFIVGTQIALRLALRHPDLIGGVVIIGGEPMRFMPSRRDAGKTPMSREERVSGVDTALAPRWFKTVTKQTFDANSFPPAHFARDSVRAAELWKTSASVPLPVMIRYLTEHFATDLSDDFPRITVPTRVLVPGFSPAMLADSTQAYLTSLYFDSWARVRGMNARIEMRTVPDARVFITHDRPDAVRDAIEELAKLTQRR